MKYFGGLRVDSFLVLGCLAGAAAGMLTAQQTPSSSAAAPAVSAPAATEAPVTLESEPQSFAVQSATQEGDAAPVLLRTVTRRVVVDVVVTGPDGKPVPGLTEQDFKVFEDRKPQSVRAFEVHTPETDSSQLPPAPPLGSHTFMNLEQTPASGPPVVVLLDYLNTPIEDQAYAHEQVVRFIKQKPASTEVAIFALSDSLSLVQGFTTDTGKLLAAMHSKAAGLRMAAASEGLMKAQITLDAFENMGKFLTTLDGRKNLLWFSESFQMLALPNASDAENGMIPVNEQPASSSNTRAGSGVSMDDLNSSAEMTGGADASQSDFGDQMGDTTVLRAQMRQVAITLAVSQTAVYPIDVRGLVVDPEMSAANASVAHLTAPQNQPAGTQQTPSALGNGMATLQHHDNFMQSLEGAQATMEDVAAATGGQAFVNTNGIALAAAKAVRDGSDYYTLVYAPSNMNFDGGLRSIHVKLDRPGCHLAYRSAYFAVDANSVTPDAIQNDSLAAAMTHGGPDAQGLIFKARIDPDGAPVMAPADSPLFVKAALKKHIWSKKPQGLSGKVQGYDIRLAILAQQLEFTASPNGFYRAELRVNVYAYAADGQLLGGTRQNLFASLPPAAYARTLRWGMYHNLHVQLPVEAASLRLAILDPDNHLTGSLEVALPLPPVQQAAAPPTPAIR